MSPQLLHLQASARQAPWRILFSLKPAEAWRDVLQPEFPKESHRHAWGLPKKQYFQQMVKLLSLNMCTGGVSLLSNMSVIRATAANWYDWFYVVLTLVGTAALYVREYFKNAYLGK